MSIFDNLISGFLLIFAAYSSYMLIKNRPDLFSSSNLSRSLTTIGVLALLLSGFVALLAYSLPHPGGETHSGAEGIGQESSAPRHTNFSDRNL